MHELIAQVLSGASHPTSREQSEDYLYKLPTLVSDEFPDDLTIEKLSGSGGEWGVRLHKKIDEAGLTKGQRSGVTHIFDHTRWLVIDNQDVKLTLGDIRELSEDALQKLRPFFKYEKPSVRSLSVLKKLFG